MKSGKNKNFKITKTDFYIILWYMFGGIFIGGFAMLLSRSKAEHLINMDNILIINRLFDLFFYIMISLLSLVFIFLTFAVILDIYKNERNK